MIDPGEIRAAIVEKLRTIEDLVEEFFDGDEELIIEYRNALPDEEHFPTFIHEMPAPAIVVSHQESGNPAGMAKNPDAKTRHLFLLILRVGHRDEGEPLSYTRMLKLIMDGEPGASGLAFQHTQIHPHSDLDEWSFSSEVDAETLDYRELEMIFQDRWR